MTKEITKEEALAHVASIGVVEIGGTYTTEDYHAHKTLARIVREQDEELGQLRLEVEAQIALREAAEKARDEATQRADILDAACTKALNERDGLRAKFDEMSCAYGDLVAERDGLRAKLKAAEDMLFTINSKLGADWVQKLTANLKG